MVKLLDDVSGLGLDRWIINNCDDGNGRGKGGGGASW